MNTTRPPFSDVRVRRALAMSLDLPVLVAKASGRGESPAWGLVPAITGYPRQNVPWKDWPLARRLGTARRLLADAGYSAGHPLVFELLYNTSENHKRLAVAVGAMWRQRLGFVDVQLRNEETKSFLLDRADPAKFQMARYTWIADYDDAASFLELAQTGNGRNDSRYSNPAYDRPACPGRPRTGGRASPAAPGGGRAPDAGRRADAGRSTPMFPTIW